MKKKVNLYDLSQVAAERRRLARKKRKVEPNRNPYYCGDKTRFTCPPREVHEWINDPFLD